MILLWVLLQYWCDIVMILWWILQQFCYNAVVDISADEDYLESNKMHGINGYLYANLPGLKMCLGDEVSWHLIGLGNEVDMHTAYFYGNTFVHDGNVKDTLSLLPGQYILFYNPSNIFLVRDWSKQITRCSQNWIAK